MEDSEILKLARKYIEFGSEEYICYAICRAVDNKYPDISKKEFASLCAKESDLRRWVYSMLEGHDTYETWLLDNHPSFHIAIRDFSGMENILREGRLQWLDWMINECEKEENANV